MKDMVRKKYFPIFFLLLYLLFIFYITLYTRSFSLTQSCNPDFFGHMQLGRRENRDMARKFC